MVQEHLPRGVSIQTNPEGVVVLSQLKGLCSRQRAEQRQPRLSVRGRAGEAGEATMSLQVVVDV